MKAVILILLIVLLFTLVGIYFSLPCFESPEYISPITPEQAIAYLEEARFTHYYLTEPGKIKAPSLEGTIDFQWKWVNRYDQVIDLIKRLSK